LKKIIFLKLWHSIVESFFADLALHVTRMLCSDFQSKNFSYAIFIVKKWPFYVNFSILLCAKWRFFQGSISLVDMRFCWHVPNSPRNKNLKSLNPYLLYKVVFLASETLLYPLSTWIFFFNFEPYDICKQYGMNV
jgi:hypothetical protein